MSKFHRDQPIPLKFKKGDMVMGFHSGGYNVGMVVGGEIVDIRQSSSIFEKNSYKIKLMPEIIPEQLKSNPFVFLLEDDAVPLDHIRLFKAFNYRAEELRLIEKAAKEHIKMNKELYLEK